MKRFLVVSGVIGMLAIGVWVEAFDFTSAYQNAKDTASSMYDKAKSSATSAYDSARGAATSAADRARGMVTSAKETATSTVRSATTYIADSVKALISSQQKAIINNPYKDSAAVVRVGNELHAEEQAYLVKRKPKVKVALEKMLGRSLEDLYVPTIAIVGSGGGYRAMLGTIGSLLAAEKIGLLDATTYITALSGATWAVAPWISTGKSLSEFKDYINVSSI